MATPLTSIIACKLMISPGPQRLRNSSKTRVLFYSLPLSGSLLTNPLFRIISTDALVFLIGGAGMVLIAYYFIMGDVRDHVSFSPLLI